MKKFLTSCTVLYLALSLGACGDTPNPTKSQSASQNDSSSVTLGNISYPVYPGAILLHKLANSASYRIPATPSDVKGWYDNTMAAEGWRNGTDWIHFGKQFQKDFLKGKSLGSPRFAEKMVKVGIGADKKGGTHLMIMPIVTRYRHKK